MNNEINTPDGNCQPENENTKRRRNPWLKVLKWIGLTIVTLAVLLTLVVGVAVWILTPERLTPLVEKYGSDFIDGELNVRRVELTYWSTFPRLEIDVDNLEVVSATLRGLSAEQREALPIGADTLLRVKSFHGGINILKLLTGTIALQDVTIKRPEVILVNVSPTLSNYSIFPTSEEVDTTATIIPDISLTRFEITEGAPIRYVSLSDSIDFNILLTATKIVGNKAPDYRIDFAAGGNANLDGLSFDKLRIGMGGDIVWDHSNPYQIELREFQTGFNDINTVINTTVDFGKDLTIEKLLFVMPPVRINSIIGLIPPQMRGELTKLKNDLQLGLTAKLIKPYTLSADRYPTLEMSMIIPEGSASYEQLHLSKLAVDLNAYIDGENLNSSHFELKRLLAIGESVGFNLEANLTDPMSDPKVNGRFRGGIDFARLPSTLTSLIGATLSGRLHADATFKMRQSDLSRENFHRMKVEGDVSLRNFNMSIPAEDVDAYLRNAELKFGTTSHFTHADVTADSLLTVSLKIDTIALRSPELTMSGAGMRLGIGCKNIASSADTTLINPIGGGGEIRRFTMYTPADSTRLRLRDISVKGALRRYNDNNRAPQLNLALNAGRIRYSDRLNRASLRESNVTLLLHPSKPKIGRRMRHAIDSINAATPGLSPDTVYARARQIVRTQRNAAPRKKGEKVSDTEKIDFEIDNQTRSLLRKWRAEGHIKAKRARLLTPYFPLRNVFSDVDFKFNNDSITIHDTKYKVGNSDFVIDGSITNLTRALTSRRGNQPLIVNFRVVSDTINVNQIAAAVFAGAAFAEHERKLGGNITISDSDNDEAVQRSIEATSDTTQAGPLLIPTNIEATVRLAARNVIYADFLFHNFRGSAEIFDGALNLRNLSARTDVGGIDLTALYQGLHPDSLSFAFGMQVRDFRLARFMELMPSLDTIMPLLRDVKGIVNAEVAATSAIDRDMNLRIPSLNAAVNITGDSLVLIDAETFRKIGKWLLFKHKDRNVINHLNARMVVRNAQMELFPFIFDIDRYKLGVYGSNDLDLNFKYHVAVLKSPIPFKFGINVSGNPDKMKIRLGGAKINEKSAAQTVAIADTTRINLLNQIENVFRRGVRRAGRSELNLNTAPLPSHDETPESSDTISHSDSLLFIKEGLLPAPPAPPVDPATTEGSKNKKKKK